MATTTLPPAHTPKRPKRKRGRPNTRTRLKWSDADLVRKVCKGDDDSFEVLVNRYQAVARKKAFAIIKDHQIAEDIAQEAFIKAYKRLKALQDPEKFSYWLMRTVQYTALDHRRAKKEYMSLEAIKEEGVELPNMTENSLDEKIEDWEEDLRIIRILTTLRPDYREIFELKHLQYQTYKEIGQKLSMSVSAVGEKLSRVRALIKKKLEQEEQEHEKKRKKAGKA